MRAANRNRRYSIALWIDRRIGTALCALLLGFKKLFVKRSPPVAPEEVRKVLLLKMWGMGSIVLASPLLAKLRTRYPNACIDFVTLRENEPILRLYPEIERVISIDLRRGIPKFLIATARTIWAIRRERYDLLFDLEFFTRFSAIFSFLSRPRRSHGFSAKGKWRGRLHDVEIPFNAYIHVASNFLTLLRGDPMVVVDEGELSGPEALPRLVAPEASARSCRERLARSSVWREGRPLVVVNPNAGDMALERRWPAEQMAELLRQLCARGSLNVAVIGAPGEREYVETVVNAAGIDASIVNLAGRLDILELVALVSGAAVLVTSDSGPLHIASAAGASTVALFGPETPVLYGPLRSRSGQRHVVHYLKLACSPCMFVHDNKVLSCWFAQARCMTGIAPADVLASVDALLSGGSEGERGAPQLRVLDS